VVTSLARPGGNVIGLTAVFADLVGKRLEILKEMLPTLTRVALLSRPANPGHVQYVQQAQMAAQILRVELLVMSANSPDEFDPPSAGPRGWAQSSRSTMPCSLRIVRCLSTWQHGTAFRALMDCGNSWTSAAS
jgi:hypothetical protein